MVRLERVVVALVEDIDSARVKGRLICFVTPDMGLFVASNSEYMATFFKSTECGVSGCRRRRVGVQFLLSLAVLLAKKAEPEALVLMLRRGLGEVGVDVAERESDDTTVD